MSDFWNNFLTTSIAIPGIVIVLGMFILAGRAAIFVDGSQATYEVGDMVEFRCGGGGGQVTGVYGTNTGLIYLTPEFKYRVKYSTAIGLKSITLQPWELEESDD